MRNLKKTALIFLFAVLFLPKLSLAQSNQGLGDTQNIPPDAYYKARVEAIVDSRYLGTGADKQLFQSLKVKILDGNEKDKIAQIDNVGGTTINGGRAFTVGQILVINKTTADGQTNYYVQDVYRLPSLIVLILIFLAIAVLFSRWKGVSSIIGLGISIAVIVKFIAPQIVAGHNPLLISLIGTVIIAVTSLYLAHGFNKRTSIALLATILTLCFSVGLAVTAVHAAKLYGNGSEESVYLQVDQSHKVNLQGLLLGGIILGALGVLDDITTAQAATVDELKKANPSLGFKRLYSGATSVGKEHISSLINTLFLAYAGVSMPLFLLLTINTGTPIWATINSEFIAEEMVRTIVGSITLIIAVPITTLLAAYFFAKTGASEVETHPHFH
jgi:uncharacterized membrane protein